MFAYLDEIWSEIGYHRTEQLSIRFSEISVISEVITVLLANPPKQIAELDVTSFEDLSKSSAPTVGLRIKCGDSARIIIRPSGTEPKLKTYIEVIGEETFADSLAGKIKEEFKKLFTSYS